MRSYKEDLELGINKEEDVLEILKCYFNDNSIINTKEIYSKYCTYDFISIEYNNKYELKTRRNTKTQYDTTLIPIDKIILNKKNNLYFIFSFTDKLCYIKYDKEKFESFIKKTIKINRIGIIDPYRIHYMIPIELLIDIN
jgi:hypothetical protein